MSERSGAAVVDVAAVAVVCNGTSTTPTGAAAMAACAGEAASSSFGLGRIGPVSVWLLDNRCNTNGIGRTGWRGR